MASMKCIHFLDQPVLQRAIGAFNTTFGFAAIRTQDLHIELWQSAAELRDAVTMLGIRARHTKHGVPVGIERPADGWSPEHVLLHQHQDAHP